MLSSLASLLAACMAHSIEPRANFGRWTTSFLSWKRAHHLANHNRQPLVAQHSVAISAKLLTKLGYLWLLPPLLIVSSSGEHQRRKRASRFWLIVQAKACLPLAQPGQRH